MSREDLAERIADALDAIDALKSEKDDWLKDWKRRMEIATSDLNEFRRDVVQMRLGEDQ